MKEYPKIDTVFNRTPDRGVIIPDEFSNPVFEYLWLNEWVWTEKVDGTNIRIMWDGENVRFGGKTDNAQVPTFLLNKLQDMFHNRTAMGIFVEKFPDGVCMYGEGYGARIQKGGGNYNKDGVDFALFDVKIGDWWLKREDIEDVAGSFDLQAVPIIGTGSLAEAVERTKIGFGSRWGDFPAEGMVLKPKVDMLDRRGMRVITKIKHKDFLQLEREQAREQ